MILMIGRANICIEVSFWDFSTDYLIFKTTLLSKYRYYHHPGKETKAQRGYIVNNGQNQDWIPEFMG